MARGPKKHLKRLAAPKHWMLDKLTGRHAPRPSQGPHKLRECIPLVVVIRNRLKYALTYHEVKMILKERLVSPRPCRTVLAAARRLRCWPPRGRLDSGAVATTAALPGPFMLSLGVGTA